MFSRRMLIVVAMILVFLLNMTILSVTSKKSITTPRGVGNVTIPVVAPFQTAIARSISFIRGIWSNYFYLVNVSKENRILRQDLNLANEQINQYREMEQYNTRLQELLNYKNQTQGALIAARVISKDSSAWFKTIMIDKGEKDGVRKGFPVVMPQGIVGQIINVNTKYSKILLIIDRNSAVDGIVQRTRSRGVVKGEMENTLTLQYALRKEDIKPEDVILTSGLDGVYPKGLFIGSVISIEKSSSGIFQDIKVNPFVDFEKLEEVLVVMKPTGETM